MKDIKLEGFMRIWYVLTWIAFIVFGMVILWVIALFVYQYKDEDLNKPKKPWLLNRSYQKLIFWYGSIVIVLLVIGFLLNLGGVF